MYKGKGAMIDQTPNIEDVTMGGIRLSQMVEIIEAWKLPSG